MANGNTERRFETAFKEIDKDDPGLVQEDDGTVWLVEPGGNRVEIQGGGGGDWGEAGTAKFSGSGTPVGNVTPTGEGDLYVDESGPGLWQANGVTDTDWEQIGAGGSEPLVLTYTFSEIAARWDADSFSAAFEVTEITTDDVLIGVIEVENTLDNTVDLNYLSAFTPGASSAAVAGGADSLQAEITMNPGTYSLQGTQASYFVGQLLPGGAAYVSFGGGGEPTEGSITVRVLKAA